MASMAARIQIGEPRPDRPIDPPPSQGPAPAVPANHDEWESYFVSCLGLIDAVVRGVGRRHRLTADEADELRSLVRLRVLADDYGILRKFQGRSSLKTYP